MNTYRDKLRTSVSDSLAEVKSELIRRKTKKEISEQNLYFAIGDKHCAEEKLLAVNQHYDEAYALGLQSVKCGNRLNNMTYTAQSAATNIANLVTNAATSAKNVQAAADAISKLSASIGSANNIAFASMHGSDIENKTVKVNELIKTIAQSAEEISVSAMKASSESAQIIAPQVLTEVTDTNSKFHRFQNKNQAGLVKLSADRESAAQNLIVTNTHMRTCEGKLTGATKTLEATQESYKRCNANLNYSFKVVSALEDCVHVAFSPCQCEVDFPCVCDEKTNYYVFAVCADLAASIALEQVEMIFNRRVDGNTSSFYALEDDSSAPTILKQTVQLKTDLDGEDIIQGKPYVLFLYLKLSNRYKRTINNFSDQISAPSKEFIFMNKLAKFHSFTTVKLDTVQAESQNQAFTILSRSSVQQQGTHINDPFELTTRLILNGSACKGKLRICHQAYSTLDDSQENTYVIFLQKGANVPSVAGLTKKIKENSSMLRNGFMIHKDSLGEVALALDEKHNLEAAVNGRLFSEVEYQVHLLVVFNDEKDSKLSAVSNPFIIPKSLTYLEVSADVHSKIDYRYLLIPNNSLKDTYSLATSLWLTANVANNISASKYLLAQDETFKSSGLEFSNPALTPISVKANMIEGETLDIFGQPIKAFMAEKINYQVWLLAISPGDETYLPVLSKLQADAPF